MQFTYLRNSGFIPRITLQGYHRFVVKETGGVFENDLESTTSTPFAALRCTVQPLTGQQLQVLDEGLRAKEAYNVFTNTPITVAVEGTNQISDQLEIDGVNGVSLFTVISVKKWNNQLIPHYHAVVVKDPNNE